MKRTPKRKAESAFTNDYSSSSSTKKLCVGIEKMNGAVSLSQKHPLHDDDLDDEDDHHVRPLKLNLHASREPFKSVVNGASQIQPSPIRRAYGHSPNGINGK